MAASADIKLIIGLGNPGEKYSRTRHNAGFWLLDRLASAGRASLRQDGKFQGEIAKCTLHGREVWLLKPMTYMNESGRAAKAVCNYYKLQASNVLVLHDEIDFPPGQVKLKQGGGHGGHNGLRSLIAHIGRDFVRIRIGVGHPGSRAEVIDSVLSRAGKADQALIDASLDRCEQAIATLLRGTLEKAMHELHSEPRRAPARKKPAKQPEKKAEKKAEKQAAVPPSEPMDNRSNHPTPHDTQRTGLKEQLLDWFRRDKD